MHARTEIRQDKTRQDEREDETRQDDTLARTDDAGADEARPIETRARADGARAEGEAPGRKRAPEASAPGIARLMEALAASGESRGLDLCARFLRLWPEDLGEAGEASVRSVFMALPPQDMSRAVAGLRAWLREDLLSQSRTRPSAADWIAQRQWDLAGSEAPEDSLRSASASDFEGLVN